MPHKAIRINKRKGESWLIWTALSYPFWSPDSQSVGFFQSGRLKNVDISTGSFRDICKAPYTLFGSCSWNRDGIIIFTNDDGRLNRVSEKGGEPAATAALDKSLGETGHTSPCFLPDGRHYLYETWLSNGTSDIYIGSLGSDGPKKLLTESRMATYVEPGYLLFQRENALYAQEFDTDNFKLSGERVRIVEDLFRNKWGDATFSVSQNGLLIYRSATAQSGAQFVWYDRDGKELGKVGNPGHYSPGFRLSPDEKQIASTGFDPVINRFCIFLIECERNVPPVRFSPDERCILPAWSPDGLKIAYSSGRKGNFDIFVKNVTGAGKETHLVESPDSAYLKDWSRDGQYVAYGATNGLYAMPLAGDKKPIPIIESDFALNTPAFSFNSKWIAFRSDESGISQIYVLPFPPGEHQKTVISTDGGVQPRWRSDGKELYYLALNGKMMAVDITLNSGIKPGSPRELFDTALNVHPDDSQYDVTADGKRFILLKPIVEKNQTLIPIVTDWTSLLNK